MIDPYMIADWFDERKKLKEKDEIRTGKIMEIAHRHWPIITHTNGSVECLVCHKMIKEVKPKWKKKI